ncbi:MAG: lipopolysaccharide heptosyltransferase I [Desulfobacterales bacterium]|nr:lipopolysaccharide heptosyltransferase I [Desulfobacterales bacterium]MBF0396550.1 lipopolysaccharide heptosyltransferase I [Desulfobacterales bacterium]
MNILIVKLSAIGDVIHTLPALNAIRKKYPNAHITWLVEEAAYPLIYGHPSIDRILLSKRKRWIKEKNIKEIYKFIKKLRDTKYDIIIDFQAHLKGAALILLAKGVRKIGYDKGMEHDEHSYIFLNERVKPVSMENHAIIRNLMLLEAIGIDSYEIEYNLPIPDNKINKSNPIIAINPIAKWDTKLWDNIKFACLADRLIEKYNADIIFTGGPEDHKEVNDIMRYMKKDKAHNFSGKTTLKTLAYLYKNADIVISTDTGPMHIAAAVNTPVVAIFGPTAPWRTGPYGKINRVVRAETKCSPCFKRKCNTKECMAKITVEQVLEEVDWIFHS